MTLDRHTILNQLPSFIHPSWSVNGVEFRSSSKLAKNLWLSQIIELPDDYVLRKIDLTASTFFYRFINAPERYLTIAGFSFSQVLTNSSDITKCEISDSDVEFGNRLRLTLSMEDRFSVSDLANGTRAEGGLYLLHYFLVSHHSCLWDMCKLSIEKHLVESSHYECTGDLTPHMSALSTFWHQIDIYLQNN